MERRAPLEETPRASATLAGCAEDAAPEAVCLTQRGECAGCLGGDVDRGEEPEWGGGTECTSCPVHYVSIAISSKSLKANTVEMGS